MGEAGRTDTTTTGQPRNGFVLKAFLQRESNLTDKHYTMIQNTVHRLAAKHLDIRCTWRENQWDGIITVCLEAAKLHPCLYDYDAFWPVHDHLKRHLKSMSDKYNYIDLDLNALYQAEETAKEADEPPPCKKQRTSSKGKQRIAPRSLSPSPPPPFAHAVDASHPLPVPQQLESQRSVHPQACVHPTPQHLAELQQFQRIPPSQSLLAVQPIHIQAQRAHGGFEIEMGNSQVDNGELLMTLQRDLIAKGRCNCTRDHAYISCPRFSEHFWAWLGEERIKNDSCTCPPMEEGLLALECPKLAEHVQVSPHVQCELHADCHLQGEHCLVPVDSTIGVTGECSCPNVERYISTRCSRYSQHLNHARKGKARSHPENPFSCSCAKSAVLISRSCMTCIDWAFQLEMDKLDESDNQTQNWHVESFMDNASAMVGSNETNLACSVTTEDHLKTLNTDLLETPNDAVTVDNLGQRSIEGQGCYHDALSPFIHEPNRAPRTPMGLLPDHGGMDKVSKVPSGVDGNSHRVVKERVDGLSPRVGYGDSLVTRSTKGRKPSAPVGSPPSRVDKKRKIEPPLKVSPDHEPSTSSPPARPSEEFESSYGGKKCKAKPLSAMPQEDYYYRKNTSLDRTYFDNVIQKLLAASYLGHPQQLEPTISNEDGDVRDEGPGRVSEGESVYAILVDRPPSGPFLCWICGHLEKQRKGLRALGHVREHFEHRPWECLQDHSTVHDENGKPKRRRDKGKDGPCGKRFSFEEALDDHQKKSNRIYKCRLGNCKRTFSTPSNRSKHERTQPHKPHLSSGGEYMSLRCLTPPLS